MVDTKNERRRKTMFMMTFSWKPDMKAQNEGIARFRTQTINQGQVLKHQLCSFSHFETTLLTVVERIVK